MLRILALCLTLTACHTHTPPQTTQSNSQSQPPHPNNNDFPWSPTTTYRDTAHGVTFRYPSAFKPEVQYAYIPPLLAQSQTVKPIAGFSYSLGGFPRTRFTGPYAHTTLEGFGIAYAAFSSPGNNACQSTAASVAQLEPGEKPLPSETINGRVFNLYQTSQAGMMKRLSGRIYAAFSQKTCYLFETGVGSVAPGVAESVNDLTPQQLAAIQAGLLRIAHSLLIAKP